MGTFVVHEPKYSEYENVILTEDYNTEVTEFSMQEFSKSYF